MQYQTADCLYCATLSTRLLMIPIKSLSLLCRAGDSEGEAIHSNDASGQARYRKSLDDVCTGNSRSLLFQVAGGHSPEGLMGSSMADRVRSNCLAVLKARYYNFILRCRENYGDDDDVDHADDDDDDDYDDYDDGDDD